MRGKFILLKILIIMSLLSGVFVPPRGVVESVLSAPTQIILENKEPEELYYFDPLPTFSGSGTLNKIDVIIYSMDEVIEGEIDEIPSSNWFALLRDVSGNNISIQSLSGGKNFSLAAGSVLRDGKYLVVATDSLSAPTWTVSKEIFIKYNINVTTADIKPCPTSSSKVEGTITRGNEQPPSPPLAVNIAYPDKKLATSQTSSGQFSLIFPGTSILGLSYLYVSDGYPATSPDNDAIVYAFIPNYSTITWTLSEVVPGAPLYNDEEGNLTQSIVLYLEDSEGFPVSGKANRFIIGLSWLSPQVKEISEGVYKIYGGVLRGNSISIYVKDVITSNKITKTLTRLTYFNPYIDVDAKYSPPPYGTGPYTDNTLGRTIFDAIPLKVGSSVEIKVGVFPIPDIKDPLNPKFTLKDNYYVYELNTVFSPSFEKHATSVNDSDLFYVKSSSGLSVKVGAIVWQRANQDTTPTWKSVLPDPYNACCVKNLSHTFSISGAGVSCDFQVSPEAFIIGKEQNLSVGVRDSFSIVHIYMLNEEGEKIQDAINVSYKQGRERKTLTDLWYNPLHISGTNIPGLPVAFSFDDNIDVTSYAGKVIFKGVSFNCITTYPLEKRRVVVEIFAKVGDTYPYCGIFEEKISVTPEIEILSGDYEVITSMGTSKFLTAMVKQSILITAPFAYQDVFFKVLLNEKPLENYRLSYSYFKVSENTYKITFNRPLPYDETYSPNKLTIDIDTFNPDRTKGERLSILIPVNKVIRESNPPQIDVSNPADNALLNTKAVTLKGIVRDDTEVKEFTINGEVFELSEDGAFEVNLALAEGENIITLKATDIFGNEKVVDIKVICDTTPPSFSFDIPSETTQEKVVIKGTTEKDAKVFFRENEIGNKNGVFSVEVSLTMGKNYFYFSFEDPAGNKSKVTVEILRRKITTIVLEIGKPVMFINSQLIEIDPGRNTVPVIKNGRTLLPIRAIIEALGGYIRWDADEQKVSIALNITRIELWIGKNIAVVNGIEKPIDPDNPSVVPEIINSRTMLPIRFIAENLGASVDWDGETKTVTITYSAP